LKTLYEGWNKTDKQIQVIVVSGDQDEAGFKSTMDGMPWVALPFGKDKSSIEAVIPCTGYPTPGVLNGTTGDVIEADAFGKVNDDALKTWLTKI
jgi:hypothetical protein